MANAAMTWRHLLDYRPTSTLIVPKPSDSTETHPFTCTHPLSPTDFLRQCGLDSGTDIVTRITNDFRSFLQTNGILDDNLPATVVSDIVRLDRGLSVCRVATESDIDRLFQNWFSCATSIMRQLFSLVDGRGVIQSRLFSPSLIFGKTDDACMSTLLCGTAVEALNAEFKRPLVLSTHLGDIMTDQTYKLEVQANGKAMISKLFLQTKANTPAKVGFFFDGLAVSFMEIPWPLGCCNITNIPYTSKPPNVTT
ncbi:hypothetical protein BDP27DRAFT_161541 [Rhodocollybia butyracea]|uniref:Uncharacterized protein n=1 Tax=Rhodocollybia butyracea TaxID=206335 RepID=A0A9P5PJL3_9AGAR|nr:hypothetical protein BDP27DRAFT_161541 [Rhodocollybia butyracea]